MVVRDQDTQRPFPRGHLLSVTAARANRKRRIAQVSERWRKRSTAAARLGTLSLRTMEAMWTRTALGESSTCSAASAALSDQLTHSRLVSRGVGPVLTVCRQRGPR